MPDVVLLYTRDCPNVRETRASLLRAFAAAGVPPAWRELDAGADDTPEPWRLMGSPTVLVDGADVAGAVPAGGASCRRYGAARAPSSELIAARLREGGSPRASAPPRGTRLSAAAIPGVLLALLPKGLCPACWPAYAAVLSSLGAGFLMEDSYLLPITIVALALATAAMLYRARSRRGHRPALIAALSGAALVLGKFVLELPDPFAYAAVTAFIAAAVWNAWPVRRTASCPACLSSAEPAR